MRIQQDFIHDTGALHGGRAATVAGLIEIHRRFCERLPDSFRWFEHPVTGERAAITPGRLRDSDVRAGRDLPVGAAALPAFLQRFEQVYGTLGKADRIVATPAAHHRLLWLRPFISSNGRVARLMSHAMLGDALGGGMVWSVARALAHNVARYTSALSHCDEPRRHGLDGRGHLSEEALGELTRLFLSACLHEVTFMERLLQPERLRARIMLWAEEEIRLGLLPAKSGTVLEAVLYRGELPRGDAEAIVGTGTRQARRMVAALTARGVLVSDSQRAPLRLAIPTALVSRWTPGLFPEKIQ